MRKQIAWRKSGSFPLFETVSGNDMRLRLWSVYTDNSVIMCRCLHWTSLNRQQPAGEMCIGDDSPIRSCFLTTTNTHSRALCASCSLVAYENRAVDLLTLYKAPTLLFAADVAFSSFISFSCLFQFQLQSWQVFLFIYSNSTHMCYVWTVDFFVLYLYLFQLLTLFCSRGRGAPVAVDCHWWINKRKHVRVVFTDSTEREKERERQSTTDILKKRPRFFQGELFPECQMCGDAQHESVWRRLGCYPAASWRL